MMNTDKLINGKPKSRHIEKWRRQIPEMFNPAFADVEHIEKKYLDLPYTTRENGPALDVYLPPQVDAPLPVIIFIHGGGWLIGDKRIFFVEPLLYLLEKGFALISINYSLSTEAEFPTPIYEVKAAIRWARAHARKYNLDPERIVLWGDSAGGHLAALAGTTGETGDQEDPSLGWAEQPSRVQAVVDWFGPINFLRMVEQGGGLQPPGEGTASMEALFLGDLPENIPETARAASPDTYITSGTLPVIIQHGDRDEVVPVQQSIDFAARLEEVAGKEKVVLEIWEGAVHEDERFYRRGNLDRIVDFLRNTCKSS